MDTTADRANSKQVMQAVDAHIKAHYETASDLVADYHAVNDRAQELVADGNFLVSYYDQREFLDGLHLNNNSGRKFSDQQVFDMYKLLLGRGIERIVKAK